MDGIHFDDYFYPYPDANDTPFPDEDTYAAYIGAGGQMTIDDWRRDNVNRMVVTLHVQFFAILKKNIFIG